MAFKLDALLAGLAQGIQWRQQQEAYRQQQEELKRQRKARERDEFARAEYGRQRIGASVSPGITAPGAEITPTAPVPVPPSLAPNITSEPMGPALSGAYSRLPAPGNVPYETPRLDPAFWANLDREQTPPAPPLPPLDAMLSGVKRGIDPNAIGPLPQTGLINGMQYTDPIGPVSGPQSRLPSAPYLQPAIPARPQAPVPVTVRPVPPVTSPAPLPQPAGTNRPAYTPKVGDVLGGVPITAAQSTTPIHFGTHAGKGVYDTSVSASPRQQIETLLKKGLIVAWRKPGDNGIASEHLHIVDPGTADSAEVARLRKQARTNKRIFLPPARSAPTVSSIVAAPSAPSAPSPAIAALASATGTEPRPELDIGAMFGLKPVAAGGHADYDSYTQWLLGNITSETLQAMQSQEAHDAVREYEAPGVGRIRLTPKEALQHQERVMNNILLQPGRDASTVQKQAQALTLIAKYNGWADSEAARLRNLDAGTALKLAQLPFLEAKPELERAEQRIRQQNANTARAGQQSTAAHQRVMQSQGQQRIAQGQQRIEIAKSRDGANPDKGGRVQFLLERFKDADKKQPGISTRDRLSSLIRNARGHGERSPIKTAFIYSGLPLRAPGGGPSEAQEFVDTNMKGSAAQVMPKVREWYYNGVAEGIPDAILQKQIIRRLKSGAE